MKVLSVTLDNELKFDVNVRQQCKKISIKAHLLKRCFYLFDIKFKITLFKIVILSSYDYCSTLFTYFSAKKDKDIITKSISRVIFKLLNVRLFDKNNCVLPLEEQVSILEKYKLIPVSLRLFKHLCSFIYSVMNSRKKAP